jgi:hypothetical protein
MALETAWFQPLKPKSENPVSNFCFLFQMQLV